MRRLVMVGAAGLALALPGAAWGDGLPVVGINVDRTGVVHAPDRFVTMPAGRDTVVARVRRRGGRIVRSRLLRGRFSVPAVALDASASGLSGDGSTLVLITPRKRFPRASTTLAVLDARSLRVRRRLTLRGDFSFDALSPDGTALYLIHYLSRVDPTRYAVQLYDLAADRMLPGPIVDPREPDERMRGLPITRLETFDGRWHYTLYDGGDSPPFIHALDTTGRKAFCIDLDALAAPTIDRYSLRLALSPDESRLSVRDGAASPAVVDTETFDVRAPVPVRRLGGRVEAKESAPISLIVPVAFVLILVAASAVHRRRARRRTGTSRRVVRV